MLEKEPLAFWWDLQTTKSKDQEYRTTWINKRIFVFAENNEWNFVGTLNIAVHDDTIEIKENEALLYGVYVSSSARRQKLAEKMIEAGIAELQSTYPTKDTLTLMVNVSQVQAIAFYKKAWFSIQDIISQAFERDGIFYDEYRMSKKLIPSKEKDHQPTLSMPDTKTSP